MILGSAVLSEKGSGCVLYICNEVILSDFVVFRNQYVDTVAALGERTLDGLAAVNPAVTGEWTFCRALLSLPRLLEVSFHETG